MLNRNDFLSIFRRILKYFVFLTIVFMFKQCTVKADMIISDIDSIRVHTYTNQTTNNFSNFCKKPNGAYNNNVWNYTYDIGNNNVVQLDMAPNGEHYNSNCSNNNWTWPDYNSFYFYITTPNFFSNVSSSQASCHIYNVNSYLDSSASSNVYQNPYNKNTLIYCDNISLSDWHYGVKVTLYVTKNGSNLPSSSLFTFTRPVFLDSIENRTFKQQVETNEKLGNILEQQQQTNDLLNSNDTTQFDNTIQNDLSQESLNDKYDALSDYQTFLNLPTTLFNSLSNTCQPISLTIPFINTNLVLPCPETMYRKMLGDEVINIIKIIVNGVFLYRIIMVVIRLIEKTIDPQDDKLEVVEL